MKVIELIVREAETGGCSVNPRLGAPCHDEAYNFAENKSRATHPGVFQRTFTTAWAIAHSIEPHARLICRALRGVRMTALSTAG